MSSQPNQVRRTKLSVRAAHWLGRNWARVHYGRLIEPTWLETNPHPIPVPHLPSAFNGFKIAQLSDLHGGEHLPADYLPHVVAVTMAQQPDVIALTGDFIHKGYRHVEDVAKIVAKLRAPHGVYAVLGNHDFSVRNATGFRRYRGLAQAVADALTAVGVRVLRNESVGIEKDDCRIYLSGLDDLWSRECDPDKALSGLCPMTPRVVLAHNPQTVVLLNGHRCDLMLSGHTHGGQINWPGVGRIFLGKQGRRFAAGMYRHQATYLYVSKGIGYGLRFRFGVRPEVAMFTLHRELPASAGEESVEAMPLPPEALADADIVKSTSS